MNYPWRNIFLTFTLVYECSSCFALELDSSAFLGLTFESPCMNSKYDILENIRKKNRKHLFLIPLIFFFSNSLFNVDEKIQFLTILLDNILIKVDGMVYIKNKYTEYLLTYELIFLWFYMVI